MHCLYYIIIYIKNKYFNSIIINYIIYSAYSIKSLVAYGYIITLLINLENWYTISLSILVFYLWKLIFK